MSDFVNYNKRDINLPSGCKNLADVLAKRSPSVANTPNSKLEKLSTIGAYVFQAWQSSAPRIHLNVRPGRPLEFNRENFRLQFMFAQLPGEGRTATFRVGMGREDEATLRSSLKAFGYSVRSSVPEPHFMLKQPDEVTCKISVIPDEPGKLTRLITAVFGRVCSLNDDGDITVYFKEDNWTSPN